MAVLLGAVACARRRHLEHGPALEAKVFAFQRHVDGLARLGVDLCSPLYMHTETSRIRAPPVLR